jgi:glycosyltransferase involved in cell wall biosynthesis
MMPRKYHEKIRLFPVNGITDEDLAVSSDRCKRQSGFKVLSAGRLLRLKAFDLAIQSFNIFAKTHPDARLEIIGEGPEEQSLRRLLEEQTTRTQIRFLGWLPRNELLKKLSESDVFLFPSLRDGGGAVIIEAMASGIPVICLNTGGPGFHIEAGTGIKIEPRDPGYVLAEMAKALENLYKDTNLRMKLGKAGRQRAESFYLWRRLGSMIQGIYQEALSGNRR